MPFKRALLAAVSMAALSVSAVAADHGGIANPPPDGVVFAEPSDWSQNPESGAVRPGPNCRQFAPTGDSTVSFAHGARLGRDYERVIVQGHAAPLGATVYDEPKAGEWVWHDENANGRFDPGDDGAYAIYVCGERTSSGLPPTDAAPPSQPHSALFMLLAAAGAAGLLLMRRHPRIE